MCAHIDGCTYQCMHALMLAHYTGTPIQNHLGELWGILNVLDPYRVRGQGLFWALSPLWFA